MGIIAYNQTTSSLSLDDLSVPNRILPASGSGSTVLTDFNKVYQIQSDEQLLAYVQSGSVVFDVGEGILNLSSSLALLNNVSSSAILSASNTGSGVGTFFDKQGTNFIFKSISGSGGVVVSSSNGTIIISSSAASGSGTGEANTASNLGSGEGIFVNKVGVDLRFRSLSGSQVISVQSGSNNTIVVSASTTPFSLFRDTVRFASTASLILSGLYPIDDDISGTYGSPSFGDRILVKNQSNKVVNGIYLASTGSWTRSSDFDSGSLIQHGLTVHVADGFSQEHSIYILHSMPSATFPMVGIDDMYFAKSFGLEHTEYLPIPETRVAGNSTRVAQTVLEGASFLALSSMEISKIVAKFAAVTSNPTMTFQIFQTANGSAHGVAHRIATVFSASLPNGAAIYEFPIQEGEAWIQQGIFYCLWGRNSATGSATLRTYTVQTLDLVNVEVPNGLHPTCFTTTILANTTGSVFYPTTQTTASILDVVPLIRLKNF